MSTAVVLFQSISFDAQQHAQLTLRADRPHNVIGMHYFSPVPKMPLLEIILHAGTAPEVTVAVLYLLSTHLTSSTTRQHRYAGRSVGDGSGRTAGQDANFRQRCAGLLREPLLVAFYE